MSFEVFTGRRFGMLTVIRCANIPPNRHFNGKTLWECRCDCGNTAFVTTNNLKNGTSTSCGCRVADSPIKKHDLTGQRFGKLTVVRATDERRNGKVVWECRCDCGNTKLVSGGSLRDGSTRSCGCLHKSGPDEELSGQRFGRLFVIRHLDERKHGHIVWECRCDCGNVTYVTTGNLKSGGTQSCGCLNRESISSFADLSGQRFGKLTAIRPIKERRHGNVVWECRCDCGNTTYVTASNLNSGTTRSCGCLRKK